MAVIPYQPTYSVQPKFGFRYMAQPAIPNVQPVQSKPVVPGLDGSKAAPPAVLGSQESTASYLDDPFDDKDFDPRDNRYVAQTLGYQAGQQNPANLLRAIPGVGTAMNLTGFSPEGDTYGNVGTYDTSGNVFGMRGRAYNPITGQAANSYASTGDAASAVSNSYSSLRDAGENPLSAALGSYDNSIYNISREDRMKGINPGMQQGIDTVYGNLYANTYGLPPDDASYYGEIPDPINVTPDLLGIDSPAVEGMELTQQIGADVGDVYISGGDYQPNIVTKSGSLVNQDGYLVSTLDPSTGENVSLLVEQEGGGYGTAGSNVALGGTPPAPTPAPAPEPTPGPMVAPYSYVTESNDDPAPSGNQYSINTAPEEGLDFDDSNINWDTVFEPEPDPRNETQYSGGQSYGSNDNDSGGGGGGGK
jgi:hypothetical protein